ncbi:MAG: hypothetical protein P8Y95_05875 [Gammaproteobacteria bacterium]|jgi:hypothetical protein
MARPSALARRVLLGLVVAIAFVFAIWRVWGVDARTLLEFLGGSVLLVLITLVPAFLVVALFRWLKR